MAVFLTIVKHSTTYLPTYLGTSKWKGHFTYLNDSFYWNSFSRECQWTVATWDRRVTWGRDPILEHLTACTAIPTWAWAGWAAVGLDNRWAATVECDPWEWDSTTAKWDHQATCLPTEDRWGCLTEVVDQWLKWCLSTERLTVQSQNCRVR